MCSGDWECPPHSRGIIAGESLFNDGIGIVLFTMFLEQATSDGNGNVSVGHAVLDSPAKLGRLSRNSNWRLGICCDAGHRRIHDRMMISLALAAGTSGPVAVVMAGLLMGAWGCGMP